MTRPTFTRHLQITDLGRCDCCGKPVNHEPMRFYVARVSQVLLNQQAARTVAGLNMHFGGALPLAQVMAPESDVYKIVGVHDPAGWQSVMVCANCGDFGPLSLASIVETAGKHEESGE